MALVGGLDRDCSFAERQTEETLSQATHQLVALTAFGSARRMRGRRWWRFYEPYWHASRNLFFDGEGNLGVHQPVSGSHVDRPGVSVADHPWKWICRDPPYPVSEIPRFEDSCHRLRRWLLQA